MDLFWMVYIFRAPTSTAILVYFMSGNLYGTDDYHTLTIITVASIYIFKKLTTIKNDNGFSKYIDSEACFIT